MIRMKRVAAVVFTVLVLLAFPLSVSYLPGQDKLPDDIFRMMSGGLYYEVAIALGLIPPPSQSAPSAPSPTPPQPPGNLNVTSSADGESEPSVLTATVGGTTYSVSTYHRWSNGYTIYASRHNHSTGETLIGQLPLDPSYPSSFDPFLDINTNSASYYGRIYNVGGVHNRGSVPRGIACWSSDDHGATWSAPRVFASTSDPNVYPDKPAVVVSPASNSAGWVYVIYTIITRTGPDTSTSRMYLVRSEDGGANFSLPVQLDDGQGTGGQVVVNSETGVVHAIWNDFANNRIESRESYDLGSTWTPPVGTDPIVVAAATYRFLDDDAVLPGGIRALTLPMARLNKAPTPDHITVVWHEAESSYCNNCADIYSVTWRYGWRPKVLLNDVTTNDQFMPSVDFDASGNGRVTFYDRREDPADIAYKLYRLKIDSYGARLGSGAAISSFSSVAEFFSNNFIGDYQQTWWANMPPGPCAPGSPCGYPFVASFIGNPIIGHNSDVWLAYFY